MDKILGRGIRLTGFGKAQHQRFNKLTSNFQIIRHFSELETGLKKKYNLADDKRLLYCYENVTKIRLFFAFNATQSLYWSYNLRDIMLGAANPTIGPQLPILFTHPIWGYLGLGVCVYLWRILFNYSRGMARIIYQDKMTQDINIIGNTMIGTKGMVTNIASDDLKPAPSNDILDPEGDLLKLLNKKDDITYSVSKEGTFFWKTGEEIDLKKDLEIEKLKEIEKWFNHVFQLTNKDDSNPSDDVAPAVVGKNLGVFIPKQK